MANIKISAAVSPQQCKAFQNSICSISFSLHALFISLFITECLKEEFTENTC